jgi:hypothetical protein
MQMTMSPWRTASYHMVVVVASTFSSLACFDSHNLFIPRLLIFSSSVLSSKVSKIFDRYSSNEICSTIFTNKSLRYLDLGD